MNKLIRLLTFTALFFSAAGQTLAEGDQSPGELLTGKAVYDDKRYALLYPASLFDEDNSPSVFRLGIVWDERNGDELRFIITFPITEQVSLDDLKKSAESFNVKIDGKDVDLPRVKNSIIRKQQSGVFSKTHEAEIRYTGSKDIVLKMLAADKVEFAIDVLMKKFRSTLKVNNKASEHFHKQKYTAINGMERFKEAVWGK